MELNLSELFLWVWCIATTTLAVVYRQLYKKFDRMNDAKSVLIAEIVFGDVIPHDTGNGISVENDDFKMFFQKRKQGNQNATTN